MIKLEAGMVLLTKEDMEARTKHAQARDAEMRSLQRAIEIYEGIIDERGRDTSRDRFMIEQQKKTIDLLRSQVASQSRTIQEYNRIPAPPKTIYAGQANKATADEPFAKAKAKGPEPLVSIDELFSTLFGVRR